MKNNRIKNPIADPASIDIEACVAHIADLKNAERYLCSEMDAEINEARARYDRENSLLSDPHAKLGLIEIRKRIGTETVRAQLWAEANRERFAKKKSIELTHGRIGFRIGTPKLALVAKWTWKKVLAALQGMRWTYRFTRIVEEIDKEAILASKLDPATLAQVGVKIVQEESFFVEPNLTELESRATAPAPANIKAA